MIPLKRTTVSYGILRKQCLDAIRHWPGCETVTGIQLIRDGSRAGFSLKVTLWGRAGKAVIDRATGCVEREMRRRYRLTEWVRRALVSGHPVASVRKKPPVERRGRAAAQTVAECGRHALAQIHR